MPAPNKTQAILKLASTDGLGMVQVEAREFACFDEALTLQIERLVQQWKHIAAPNAERPARRSSRRENKAE